MTDPKFTQPSSTPSQDSLPSDALLHPAKQDALSETMPKLSPNGTSKRAWRFWVPMLIQSAFIIAVPFQSAVTYATGKTVTLQTIPVDPYDFLRGYSQTLRYDISRLDVLKKLPGGVALFKDGSQPATAPFYVVLEAPRSQSSPPTPWKPVRVSRDRPQSLATNQVALKGRYERWQVVYGLETYYMPENQRKDINANITQLQRTQEQAFVVDIRVDGKGNSVPVSLWLSDRQYRF